MKKAPIAPPNSRWLVLPTRLDVSIGGRSTGSLFSGSFALFSNLADLLVGVTARSIDLRLRLGDWAFPRVGVSALDFAGEALFVRAGERVFLSAEAGDFRTFLLRLRERLLDLLLDVDLEVDLLPFRGDAILLLWIFQNPFFFL